MIANRCSYARLSSRRRRAGQDDGGGELVVRRQVDGAEAPRLDPFDAQAILVQRNRNHTGTVKTERLDCRQEAQFFHRHHVSWSDECPGQKRETHLAAPRDADIVRSRRDSSCGRQHGGDGRAQTHVSVRVSVR